MRPVACLPVIRRISTEKGATRPQHTGRRKGGPGGSLQLDLHKLQRRGGVHRQALAPQWRRQQFQPSAERGMGGRVEQHDGSLFCRLRLADVLFVDINVHPCASHQGS